MDVGVWVPVLRDVLVTVVWLSVSVCVDVMETLTVLTVSVRVALDVIVVLCSTIMVHESSPICVSTK